MADDPIAEEAAARAAAAQVVENEENAADDAAADADAGMEVPDVPVDGGGGVGVMGGGAGEEEEDEDEEEEAEDDDDDDDDGQVAEVAVEAPRVDENGLPTPSWDIHAPPRDRDVAVDAWRWLINVNAHFPNAARGDGVGGGAGARHDDEPDLERLRAGFDVAAWPLYGPGASRYTVHFVEPAQVAFDATGALRSVPWAFVVITDSVAVTRGVLRGERGGTYHYRWERPGDPRGRVQPLWVSSSGRWVARRAAPEWLDAGDSHERRAHRAYLGAECGALSAPTATHYIELYDSLLDLVDGRAPLCSFRFPVLSTAEYPQYAASLSSTQDAHDDRYLVAMSDAPSMQDGVSRLWVHDRLAVPSSGQWRAFRTGTASTPLTRAGHDTYVAVARAWRHGETEFVYGVGHGLPPAVDGDGDDTTEDAAGDDLRRNTQQPYIVWNQRVYTPAPASVQAQEQGQAGGGLPTWIEHRRATLLLPSAHYDVRVGANECVPRWRSAFAGHCLWFVGDDRLLARCSTNNARRTLRYGLDSDRVAAVQAFVVAPTDVGDGESPTRLLVTYTLRHRRALPWRNAHDGRGDRERRDIVDALADALPLPSPEDVLARWFSFAPQPGAGGAAVVLRTAALTRRIAGIPTWHPVHQVWACDALPLEAGDDPRDASVAAGAVISSGDTVRFVQWDRFALDDNREPDYRQAHRLEVHADRFSAAPGADDADASVDDGRSVDEGEAGEEASAGGRRRRPRPVPVEAAVAAPTAAAAARAPAPPPRPNRQPRQVPPIPTHRKGNRPTHSAE